MYKMPEMEQMKRGIAHLQGEVKRFKEDASAQKEDVAMLKRESSSLTSSTEKSSIS
ncbi:hypothetical protein PNH38_03240 [Anoxybacillus rupiensis]|nr:hypothetical protein [Anoxybacillus rupiensis]